jgi:hypothetical protein
MNDEMRRAIIAAQGDHAIFAPSSSAGWLYCEDYLAANYGKPDNGNEDAAYGTVGHSVGETWLDEFAEMSAKLLPLDAVRRARPTHLVGTTAVENGFKIDIDDEMLSYVQEYVEWCAELPGDHFVETRVDFSDLTPIPGQGGTADHAACEFGRLTITDLKMGKGIKVFAKNNTQALLYAYGFFREWDWWYGFKEIVIRIAQPRIEHFDTWTITRDELIRFAKWAGARAERAWIGGSRAPGTKTCQWCKDVACAARLAALHEDTDDVFECVICEGLGCDACKNVIDAEYKVVETTALVAVKADLDAGWNPADRDPTRLSTHQLEKILRLRKTVEKWFSEIEKELEARHNNGEALLLWKLVEGRAGHRAFDKESNVDAFVRSIGVDPLLLYKSVMLSPAQFEEIVRQELGISKKKAAQLISPAVIRPPGKDTLALISDEREGKDSSDDVFDDLTADEL